MVVTAAVWWLPIDDVLWDFSAHPQLHLLANFVFIVAVLVGFAASIFYGHGDFFGLLLHICHQRRLFAAGLSTAFGYPVNAHKFVKVGGAGTACAAYMC